MNTTVRFPNKEGKEFFADLRDRVNQYFIDNKLSQHANAGMIAKTVILFSLYFGMYALILTNIFPLWAMLLFAILMGVGKAGLGFSVAHDALHGSYSSKSIVNKLLGLSMEVIGGSAYLWKITHNVIHHTYTNIHPIDEDLEASDMMRLCPNSRFKPIHRFQHIYFPFAYGFATLYWVFAKDYKVLFQKNIGSIKKNNPPVSEVILLLAFKLIYYSYTIVIPLLVLHITWWQFLIGFLAMHFTAGLILGLVFQLAHVVEQTLYLQPDEKGQMENAWAIHQMKTTANFARNNGFANWYMGGLNYQIEHHLFTNICSVHYPALSHIVREVALKHNVPYNENKTFRSAVHSHYMVLKELGPKYYASLSLNQPAIG